MVEKPRSGKVPLVNEGAVAHVSLEDGGTYVRWLLHNTQRANGVGLEVAIGHVHYAGLVSAFARVMGHSVWFEGGGLEWEFGEGALSMIADWAVGCSSEIADLATMPIEQNFNGFWNVFCKSGSDEGVIRRNYALLDEIHPKRIRSVEEWLRKGRGEGKGSLWDRIQPDELKPILELYGDVVSRPVLGS